MDRLVGWELFWSASGRLARAPFLICSAGLIVAAAFYETWVPRLLHWLTGWVVYPVLLYCGACLISKRLHDRGRSGWWAALVLLALIAVWPSPHGAGGFIFALVLAWAAIELGVMNGEDGANRFGPSPLAGQAA